MSGARYEPTPGTRNPGNYLHGLGKLASTLLCCIVLAGCASQMAYREGKNLVEQGKVEAGLAKIQEALTHDPRAVEYRMAYLHTRDGAIANYLNDADRLAADNKWTEAEHLYQRALAIDANNARARDGLRALEADQRHSRWLSEAEAAWNKKDADTAQHKLAGILKERPSHAGALALKRSIAEKTARAPADTVLSAAYKKPITIEFKDVALKQVFEVISRTSGLNFLFDKDVKTDQKTSIFLKNSTIASAVYFTLLTNQLEQQVLDGNTILIYPNTAAKLKDYQEMVVKTFFLANADAKAVANSLKTIVKSRDVVVDEKLNLLIVRDSPEAIRLAEKLVAIQDIAEPEVMLEVEILEIKRSQLQELGIKWPDSLTLTPLPGTAGGTLTLRNLRTNLNSGTVSAAVGSAIVNAKQQDSDANILANPRIRARNREKAKILIGERVPNITTTSTSTGFVSESVNYLDVGLKLEVEPSVHLDNDVAIKISLEVSNIVNQLQTKSGSLAYQIGTRTATTVLRLKDGENQVLAGLINDEDRRSASKMPGVGELPLLGRLFGSTADNSQKTEIVLSITPRLIRNIQRPDATLAEFISGTDSSLRTRPDSGSAAPSSSYGVNVNQRPVLDTAPNRSSSPHATAPQPASAQPGATSIVQNSEVGGVAGQGISLIRLQGPTQAKVGNLLALQVVMQADQPITSLPIAIGFDNKVFQVVNVAEGDFLKQGGAHTSFSSRIDPGGQILLTGTRTSAGGSTTAGVVATIQLRPIALAAESRLELLTAAPVGMAGRSVAIPLPAPHAIQVQP